MGQGANTALPIFGLFMQKCLASGNYDEWAQASFPALPPSLAKELEAPAFKERLNLMEKLKNNKTEKVKPEADSPAEAKERKGFFRRIGDLFKKKDKKRQEDEKD